MEQKIMIIIWKWDSCYELVDDEENIPEDDILNAILVEPNIKQFLDETYHNSNDSDNEKQHYIFQEFKVEGDSNCKIVGMNIYNGGRSIKVIDKLIELYSSNSEIMLFLHKLNWYNKDNVVYFSKQYPKVKKCFLIRGNFDYIYNAVSPNEGFLGVDNNFASKENFSVLNDLGELKVEYFNNVWLHYQYVVKSKIFALKSDFIEAFYAFSTQKVLNNLSFLTFLKKNRDNNLYLYYRLNSFLGKYNSEQLERVFSKMEKTPLSSFLKYAKYRRNAKKEFDDFFDYERKKGVSLNLDTCTTELLLSSNQKYLTLSSTLIKYLFPECLASDVGQFITINNDVIQNIRNDFDVLIDSLEGAVLDLEYDIKLAAKE